MARSNPIRRVGLSRSIRKDGGKIVREWSAMGNSHIPITGLGPAIFAVRSRLRRLQRVTGYNLGPTHPRTHCS